MTEGLAHSVQVRLVRHAKESGLDPNHVLARYAVERLLYRLSRSPYADRFVLKGALLLLAWLGETIRPTRDADLLGFGDLEGEALARCFSEIVATPVEPDGMEYDPETIRVVQIRREDPYGGRRVTVVGHLGTARLKVQVDVGAGDSVVPEPRWLEYPSLLDLPRPRLRAYRPETAIAEKLHAMVTLGSRNSRLRDFFDIRALAMHGTFDGEQLARAVSSTFSRRGTEIPRETPIALTPAFASIEGKRAQWRAFVRRSGLAERVGSLEEVAGDVAVFLLPVLESARGGRSLAAKWRAGGPWRATAGGHAEDADA